MNISPQYFEFRRGARLPVLAAVLLSCPLAASVCAQSAHPSTAKSFVNTLMPLPVRMETGRGALAIDASFTYLLRIAGRNTGLDATGNGQSARLGQGAVRLLSRIEMRTGVRLAKTPAAAGENATLTVDVAAAPTEAAPLPREDESYTLDVDEHRISLRANTDIGALRGMETLLELVEPADGSGFAISAVHIEDAPRFPWRGLLVDPGRHFMPVPVILRTLDGMAAVKMNVLHWHLTEDQGFRIESRVFPKLQEMGSGGLYYTQQQVREVVAYASARGIRVLPEFDMPGHAQSWMVGYPELGSAPGPFLLFDKFGVSDAAMDPTRESTYRFLDAFLGEMAQLFPDAYIHIGGDESNGREWRANAHIRAFMKERGMKTTAELQAYFNTRVEAILAKHHKLMVGWDEILGPTLPRDAVIQNWHGIEFLVDAARQGHRGLLSHPYYLDHMDSAADMFLADPLPSGSGLTAEQAALVEGGEACMWGEFVTPATIDSRIWPRTAAIAERLWSPASDRDAEDMYRRLGVESLRLEAEGLRHISGPAEGLRELAGTAKTEPLELFAATVQPVDFHVRGREQRPTPATVFNKLVDFVRPDPPLRHEIPALVDGALGGDRESMARLDALFHSWVEAAPAVERMEADSPMLKEAAAHIAAWPKLGTMGVEALGYVRSGSAPPAGWKERQLVLLQEAVKPGELVDFVVLSPLKELVEGVSTSKIR